VGKAASSGQGRDVNLWTPSYRPGRGRSKTVNAKEPKVMALVWDLNMEGLRVSFG
jgi:hypothetical protein